MTVSAAGHLRLRVHAIRYEARDVCSLELRSPTGSGLPPFSPGAHIDLSLPAGIERSYSLINDGRDPLSYCIAVQRSPESRGGSAFLCDRLRVGDSIDVGPPRNSFGLDQDSSALSVLIAGGIGITPLWAMVQELERDARPWRLYYAARSRDRAAFLHEIDALERRASGRVTLLFDDEAGVPPDLVAIVAAQPADAHFYCCGPAGMLKAFRAATSDLPARRVHWEYFAAEQAPAHGGFDVVLAKSGATFRVPRDRTILETLIDAGYALPHSCMSGVCGTCETAVLEGVPDHRDQVLSDRERAGNGKMMICCSGCQGDRLVLDL